jgi:acetyl esterase/lipase
MPKSPEPEPFHPSLRAARWIPPLSVSRRTLRMFRASPKQMGSTPEVSIEEVGIRVSSGERRYRVFRPVAAVGSTAALFWIHGGGLISGTPQQDDATNERIARELGITVIAASYRLAPEHPAPAALDDLVEGYHAVLERAEEWGVDAARVVVGGASAGGGLAAALCQRLHDEGGPEPIFQLLVYPMLDDRTVLRRDIDLRHVRVWTTGSNRFGWESYLGGAPGRADVPAYAAPARRDDLSGLPPAWIGVGSLDLFHDEDLEYARRLEEAGVPCELFVLPGAFHGFDALLRRSEAAERFHDEWVRVLGAALGARA